MKSLNGQVEIIDIDKFCLLVKNISRNATGIRTVSKEIVNEFVNYFEKHPNNSAQQAREELAGLSQIDKFEYGYCSTLTILAKMILGDELSDEDKKLSAISSHPFSNLSLQVIYYGAPGTGKSYTIDKITTEENSVRTTFHPDTDYASFVGAYKPTMENLPVSAIVGKEVHEAVPQGNHTGKEKKIVYKYVPQAFLKAYVKAWGDLENPYYLIIEEINRGNCAQIFGDLFQLLDRNNMGASSYPILADEDITRFLNEDENGFAGLSEQQKNQISDFVLIKDSGERRDIGEDILKGKHLLLPPNLYIWATMNTSDQSLFPIDSAFKRRWDWEYMPIDYNPTDTNKKTPLNWKLKIGNNLYDWGTFLSKINPEIETLTESSDKQMGYFFVKANPLTGIISEEVFKNKVLFYLWTEVLKDFDMGKDPFINPETNKSFKFTDFFDKEQNALANFIKKLELPLLKNDNEDEEIELGEDLTDPSNDAVSASRAPSTTFIITLADGTKISDRKAQNTLIKFLKYVGLDKVKNLGLKAHNGFPFLSLETDPGFDQQQERYKKRIENTEYFMDPYYSTKDFINKFVKVIAEQVEGLEIANIEIVERDNYQDPE